MLSLSEVPPIPQNELIYVWTLFAIEREANPSEPEQHAAIIINHF